jgi:hypothetical protein
VGLDLRIVRGQAPLFGALLWRRNTAGSALSQRGHGRPRRRGGRAARGTAAQHGEPRPQPGAALRRRVGGEAAIDAADNDGHRRGSSARGRSAPRWLGGAARAVRWRREERGAVGAVRGRRPPSTFVNRARGQAPQFGVLRGPQRANVGQFRNVEVPKNSKQCRHGRIKDCGSDSLQFRLLGTLFITDVGPQYPLNLDPAVAAREAAIGLLAASGCRRSACHPGGDLRRSWKSLAANAEQGGAAA